MVNSFTGVIGQVQIEDIAGGTGLHDLWVPDYPFLVSIEIIVQGNAANTINVGIDAPYDEGLELLNSSLFANMNPIRARIGYGGTLDFTPWVAGTITDALGLTVSPDGVSGTITAAAKLTTWTTEPGAYREGTVKKLVEHVLKRRSASVVFDDGADEILGRYDVNESFAGRKMAEVVVDFLRKYGCVANPEWDENDKLTWFVTSDGYQSTLKPDRKYIMRGRFDQTKREYPIVSFSPVLNAAMFMPGTLPDPDSYGVSGGYIDSETGEEIHVEAKPGDEEGKTSGEVSSTSEKDDIDGDEIAIDIDDKLEGDGVHAGGEKSSTREFPQPLGGEDEANDQAKQMLGKAVPSFEATIESIGVPFQKGTGTISVAGCGRLFDGTYMVKGVTHAYAAGSYATIMQATRNGRAADMTALKATKTSDGENTEEAETGGE